MTVGIRHYLKRSPRHTVWWRLRADGRYDVGERGHDGRRLLTGVYVRPDLPSAVWLAEELARTPPAARG